MSQNTNIVMYCNIFEINLILDYCVNDYGDRLKFPRYLHWLRHLHFFYASDAQWLYLWLRLYSC